MNQVSMPARLTPKAVLEFMGLGAEGEGGTDMPPIAWFLIQSQASGSTLGEVAVALGVGEEDLVALRDSVTQTSGDESEEVWSRGILALKVAAGMNSSRIATGWDAIEAMAVEKLGNQLAAMNNNGKWDEMLDIATKANKAIRRGKGEGMGSGKTIGTSINVKLGGGESGAEVDMQSGEIGSLRLTLSPRIREQLGNPNRVIETTAHRILDEKKKPSNQNLEMLRLHDARALVDSSDGTLGNESKPDKPGPVFDLKDMFEDEK